MTTDGLAAEIASLVEAQLEGRATSTEQRRLEELAGASAESLSLYLKYISDSVMLSLITRRRRTAVPPAERGPTPTFGVSTPDNCPPAPLPPSAGGGLGDSPRASMFSIFLPTERWLDAMPVVMFAVLMLAIGAFVGWRMGTRQSVKPQAPEQPVAEAPKRPAPRDAQEKQAPVPLPAHAATLVDARNCEWIEAPADFRPGVAVAEGTELRLAAGVAEIMFRSGVRVTLEGPAVLSAISAAGGALESGSLAAEVPPDAVGFAVRTPAATVIDLSTSFGVTVEPARVTEVHVIEGRVAIESFASARRRVIEQGHAWRLPSRDPQSWVEIKAVPERFYRTASTRFSPAAQAEVFPSEPAPPAPAAGVSPLPAIDGAVSWTILAGDTFDASEVNLKLWEITYGPAVRDRRTDVQVKDGHVELVNTLMLMTRASYAAAADKPLRATAYWQVGGGMDKPTIAVDANPTRIINPKTWLTHGIMCTFGAINPQTGKPALVIQCGYPNQERLEPRFEPCPAPEAGVRYRLDVVRYARRVTFHVTCLDGEGWSRSVACNIPEGFVPAAERRVAVANFDLESSGDVVSRVEEITVSTWETPGGQ